MIRALVCSMGVTLLAGAQQPVVRNPRELKAVEILAQRRPGVPPRVRFEWDQVAGAHEYLLRGHWTTPTSWSVRASDYHVTPKTATTWGGAGQNVEFDVTLPEGHHSWTVVALFGTSGVGDFASPTAVTFELR
ncbi:MAG TPA: hypothetical protein VGH04_01730 [Gemmatimonadaceae bacterium]